MQIGASLACLLVRLPFVCTSQWTSPQFRSSSSVNCSHTHKHNCRHFVSEIFSSLFAKQRVSWEGWLAGWQSRQKKLGSSPSVSSALFQRAYQPAQPASVVGNRNGKHLLVEWEWETERKSDDNDTMTAKYTPMQTVHWCAFLNWKCLYTAVWHTHTHTHTHSPLIDSVVCTFCKKYQKP